MSSVPSESRLQAQEDIRGPLSELQQQVLPDIQDQIQDYRLFDRRRILHDASSSVCGSAQLVFAGPTGTSR